MELKGAFYYTASRRNGIISRMDKREKLKELINTVTEKGKDYALKALKHLPWGVMLAMTINSGMQTANTGRELENHRNNAPHVGMEDGDMYNRFLESSGPRAYVTNPTETAIAARRYFDPTNFNKRRQITVCCVFVFLDAVCNFTHCVFFPVCKNFENSFIDHSAVLHLLFLLF